jgi:hypothetical protein
MAQGNQYLRGGFAKGTRVQLRDRLCAIENVQIGDEVLAAHSEDTGQPMFRPVTHLLRYEHQPIHYFRYTATEGGNEKILSMAATENVRLFAGILVGWAPLSGLRLLRRRVLEEEWPSPREGLKLSLMEPQPVYRTATPGVGWEGVRGQFEIHDRQSNFFNYQDYAIPEKQNGHIDGEIYDGPDPYLEVTVFHLVVEELHSFYIGQGLLAHDAFLKVMYNPQHYY